MLLGTQSVNEAGHLAIAGCDVLELSTTIRHPRSMLWMNLPSAKKCRSLRAAYEKRYPNSLMLFAAKSFLNMAIVRIMDEEGMGLEPLLGWRGFTPPMRAGFPMERAYLHGNNKAPWELTLAMESGIGRIVLDNEREMAILQEIACARGQIQEVLLRVTPGIKPQTHSFIQTGANSIPNSASA